ncbi:sulfatase [Bacteroidota bacterium]
MKFFIPFVTLAALLSYCPESSGKKPDKQPNILILYIDDMGYSQPSCYGGELISTPNMDQIAANGIRFTNGYVSAPICGPSRVGLLTGRYQARTGHDANSGRAPGKELDLNEVTLAEYLKKEGYKTGIVGKWHLGETELAHLPLSRGFDYYVGHGGNINEKNGRQYMKGNKSVEFPAHPITSETWGKRAVEFISENCNDPFFLYLAFNAIHTPIVAKEETLEKLSYIENKQARLYAGLIKEADDAIGEVMKKLRDLDLLENTLVFCISDNGGAYPIAEMNGFRGRKWYVFEGGIRVPYMVQWKGVIEPGRISDEPVIQLDVLPTALAAAGGNAAPEKELDGLNLLPLLTGKKENLGREALYWRFGSQFAIRKGDWKLVKAIKTQDKPMLVNLKNDPGERYDLAEEYPEITKELQEMWNEWNSRMKPPRWNDDRWNRDDYRSELQLINDNDED